MKARGSGEILKTETIDLIKLIFLLTNIYNKHKNTDIIHFNHQSVIRSYESVFVRGWFDSSNILFYNTQNLRSHKRITL